MKMTAIVLEANSMTDVIMVACEERHKLPYIESISNYEFSVNLCILAGGHHAYPDISYQDVKLSVLS